MAMTVKELRNALATLPDDTEVVTTFLKFGEYATEQFADRISLTKLADGREVLAIDGYKHANNYELAES